MFGKKLSRALTKTLMFKNNNGHVGMPPMKPLMKSYSSNCLDKHREISLDKKAYNEALPSIINNLVNRSRLSKRPDLVIYLLKIFDYNLMSGNNSLAVVTMITYNMLESHENFCKENQHLAKVLGWCLAMLHCSVCLVDDITDGSTTRRGEPCWHLKDNVGTNAINDAFLLSACVTEILEMYFSKRPQYTHILHLFHKANMYIYMGQVEDTMVPKKKDYSLYTMDFYNHITYCKSGCNSIQIPIELGMTLVKDSGNKINTKQNAVYDNVTFKIGKLFQMQNDYDDCYTEEELIGKIGTDIEEGKCTWLAATALQHCNEQQRERFVKYYGNKDPEHVAKIKSLYDELQIPELYKQETIAMHDDIVRNMNAWTSQNVSNLFYKILDNLLLRSEVWGYKEIQIQ